MNDQINHDVLEDKFRELIAFANRQKGVIEAEKVNTLISELNLDNNQIDKIYERLEAYSIVVLSGSEEDEPNDELLLELDEDVEEAQSEVEALTSSSYTMSDDPVHLYLKEIGNYPLLSMSDEVELAKKIADGDELAKQLLAESNLRLVVSMQNVMLEEAYLSSTLFRKVILD